MFFWPWSTKRRQQTIDVAQQFCTIDLIVCPDGKFILYVEIDNSERNKRVIEIGEVNITNNKVINDIQFEKQT